MCYTESIVILQRYFICVPDTISCSSTKTPQPKDNIVEVIAHIHNADPILKTITKDFDDRSNYIHVHLLPPLQFTLCQLRNIIYLWWQDTYPSFEDSNRWISLLLRTFVFKLGKNSINVLSLSKINRLAGRHLSNVKMLTLLREFLRIHLFSDQNSNLSRTQEFKTQTSEFIDTINQLWKIFNVNRPNKNIRLNMPRSFSGFLVRKRVEKWQFWDKFGRISGTLFYYNDVRFG